MNRFILVHRAAQLARKSHVPIARDFRRVPPTLQQTIKKSIDMIRAEGLPHHVDPRSLPHPPSVKNEGWGY